MLTWERTELLPVFALTVFTVGYLAYHFITHSTSIKEAFEKRLGIQRTAICWILVQKLAGFFFMGVVPAVAMIFIPVTFKQVGVSLSNITSSLLWSAILGVVIVVINLFAARRPSNLSMYPQIRLREWTYGILVASSLGWILYLLGYEFLFRGVLLFLCVPVFGVWPSIVLNVSLYAIVHIPKGLRESLASIPMGLLLCILTWKTETIWVAFFAHVVLALSNEYLSIFFHPDMSLRSKPSRS